MALALLLGTGALYLLASGLYLALVVRGAEASGRTAYRVLAVGALAHVALVIVDYATLPDSPLESTDRMFSLTALAVAVLFLLRSSRGRLAALGAFITPLILLFLVAGSVGRGQARVPSDIGSVLLMIHIGVSVLGIAAFTLAFGAAAAYVLQERQLRRKQLVGSSQRLPPLDVLDTTAFRLLTVGFPLFTLGIVLGAVRAFDQGTGMTVFFGPTGFAFIAWLIFAVMLLLRVVAGWRGRRAAIGTILGYACAAAVLVGYMLRALGGDA